MEEQTFKKKIYNKKIKKESSKSNHLVESSRVTNIILNLNITTCVNYISDNLNNIMVPGGTTLLFLNPKTEMNSNS